MRLKTDLANASIVEWELEIAPRETRYLSMYSRKDVLKVYADAFARKLKSLVFARLVMESLCKG
jgi:hypothetical protein